MPFTFAYALEFLSYKLIQLHQFHETCIGVGHLSRNFFGNNRTAEIIDQQNYVQLRPNFSFPRSVAAMGRKKGSFDVATENCNTIYDAVSMGLAPTDVAEYFGMPNSTV